jgi:hypothetical protein
MGRGSGADANLAASEEVNTRNADEPISDAEIAALPEDKEKTTLRVLVELGAGDPEAEGFGIAEIAATGLPELSPKEREGFFRVIAETADSLVEKGLAEEASPTDDPMEIRWKITDAGAAYGTLDGLNKRGLRVSDLGVL